jgi:SAM-dependent methyltransferase
MPPISAFLLRNRARGQITTVGAVTTTAQEAFLLAFHARHPAVTPQAIGAGRAPDGRSSYAIVRDRVAGVRRVLDLGCGDGHLLDMLDNGVGVDVSPESVALAVDRGAVAVVGRAQDLPFAGGTFDACVSHMTFMLMDDEDRVARELARVLRPGGVFAAVLGGGGIAGQAWELFRGLAEPVLAAHPGIPALGDRRTRERAGLDAILGPAGFAPVEWETVLLDLSGSPQTVWSTLAGFYEMAVIAPDALAELRAEFLARAADTPSLSVPLTIVVTRLS